eukprot:1105352-Alexandrium_andersonii.AAC.1
MLLPAGAVLDHPAGLLEVPAQAAAVEVVLLVVALWSTRPAAFLLLRAGCECRAHALHGGLERRRVRGDGHPSPAAARDHVEVHPVEEHVLPHPLRTRRHVALHGLREL